MTALLQKWFVFGRTQTKKVLNSLEFNYFSIKSLDFMKKYFSEALQKQKESNNGKPMMFFQKEFFWKNLKKNWKQFSDEQSKISLLRNKMVSALVFWKFVRSMIRDESYSTSEKREFLKNFFQDANNYIQIIAILECLPDTVFKKVLWKGNIDFPSFEAFLRRLQPEQEALIRKTYNQFFVEEIHHYTLPSIYKGSVREAFRFCFERTSAQKLKDSAYGEHDRWVTKDAWAFNLLGLDFGFGLYPNGIKDDTKITNKKYTRFFSVKNHIKDFVVNQFDGKYWWFYKTARSNYVWRPDATVKLKNHICPGFWATLIMHFVFWVLSPIAFSLVYTHWMKTGHSFHFSHFWPVLVSLIPTPLFILIALLKLGIRLIEKHGGVIGRGFTAIGTGTRDWFKKRPIVGEVLHGILAVILIIIASAIVLGLSSLILYGIWIGAPYIHLTTSTIAIISVTVLSHIIFQIVKKLEIGRFDEYSSIPKWLMVSSLFSLLLIGTNTYDYYAAKYVTRFIVETYQAIKGFVLGYPVSTAFFVLSTILSFINSKFLGLSLKYEDKFAQRTGLVRFVSTASGLIIAGLCYAMYVRNEVTMDYFEGSGLFTFVTLFAFTSFVIVGLSWLNTIKINEETVALRAVSRKTIDVVYANSAWSYSKALKYETKFSFKALLKNKWLLSLTEKERTTLVTKIVNTVRYLYSGLDPDKRVSAMNRFIKRNLSLMDKSHFLIIRNVTTMLMKLQKSGVYEERQFFQSLTASEINLIVQSVINGEDFLKVVQVIKEERLKWETKMEKLEKFGNVLYRFSIGPIVWLFKKIAQPFIWFGRKISQFFMTLKDLYVLFNERCPYVSRSRTLE